MTDDEFKDTEIGRIPKEWEIKKLSQLIEYKKGKTPKKVIKEYKEKCLPYLSTEYLRENKITAFVEGHQNVVLVNDDDIILLWDGSNAGEFFLGKQGILSSTMVKIDLKENINKKFLFFILKMNEDYFKRNTKGTGIPHVDKNILLDFTIPFPPLEEQKKIAYVLSKIQKAIELQNRLIKSLQELKKTMMHKLFTEGIGHTEFKDTEIGRIPKDWEIRRIKDISLKIKAGGTPSKKEIKYWGGNIPFVLINDIVNSSIYLYKTKEFITELGLKNSSTWIVPSNSLLVSIYATIGEVVINKIPVATNQAIIAIMPMPDFNVEYGLYVIKYYKNILYKQIVQTTQKNINKAIFQNLTVPLPHLEEQKKIANILLTIDNKISLEKNRKDSLEKLFKTMLNKLMTGQIRVKDLNVEVFGV